MRVEIEWVAEQTWFWMCTEVEMQYFCYDSIEQFAKS